MHPRGAPIRPRANVENRSIMATHDSDAEIILRDLRERAKELNCLYTVEELTSEPDLSLERIVEA